MSGLFNIKDKAIVITGGAWVLCGAMATGLARLGAKICVVDYDVRRANELCKQIEAQGYFAIPVQADVTDKRQVEEALTRAIQTMGKVDVPIAPGFFDRAESLPFDG